MEKRKDVKGLIKALKHKDKDVREKVARALGNIGDAIAVEPLIQALKDGDWSVRYQAVEALGKIGDARAVESLIQTLKNGVGCVRWRAVEALSEIGDARAVEPLLQALEDIYINVQNAAAKAIGEIGDLRAAEAIIYWLFMPKTTWVNSNLERPGLIQTKGQLDSWIVAMKNLFGDYTALIIKASIALWAEWAELSDKAFHKLCEFSTQISSNILHKISTRKDVWCARPSEPALTKVRISFESQREMAKKELERRGNPPYDPSAYLNKEAWKLSDC